MKLNIFQRRSISKKIILLTSSLIIFTSLTIIFLVMQSERNHLYQDLLKDGKSLAAIIAQNSEYSVYTEDKDSLRQIMLSIITVPDIVYVAVLDARKNILSFKIKNPEVKETFKVDRDLNIKSGQVIVKEYEDRKDGKNYIEFIAPVISRIPIPLTEDIFNNKRLKPITIGYIHLGFTTINITERINEFIITALGISAVFVFLGILLAIFIAKKITFPIQQLQIAAKNLSAGNFDQYVEVNSSDEISDLGLAFNDMLVRMRVYNLQIQSHSNEISEINQNLIQEIKVRKRAEISLITTKARLQHLLTSTPAVIYSCKPYGDFSITFVSENVEKLTGYKPREFMENQRLWLENIHKDEVSHVLSDIIHVYESGRIILEYRFRHRNGTYIWLHDELNLMRDEEGNPGEIVGYWIDITNRKELETQLQHDALHDALTDLPNRALFLDRLELHLARSKRYNDYLYAVLFLDIDRFKNVNDSLGHVVGDNLLKLIAERLRSCVHQDDTVARLGGDEFAIILDNIKSVKCADEIAERIHNEMKTPFRIEDQDIFLGTSIGIAVGNKNYDLPEQLLRDADTAMYHAKALGGTCHEVFDLSMHEKAVSVLQIENDLRNAVERKEFIIHYQPIITIKTGEVKGFEALLRWRHPIHGLIPPQAFIPVAEETGLIVPIGQWILMEACSQLRSWQNLFHKTPPLTMSVNISGKQIASDFIDQIKHVLHETRIKTNSLILEITESTIMKNVEPVTVLLKNIKTMNVQVHIDDFGTGYSSLSYLQNFSIDALKLDRSFIRTIGTEKENLEIIRIISDLSHSLNIDIIAEGVETPKQLAQVKTMKYEYAQGYLFSKALNSEKAEKYLSERLILV